MTQYEELV